MTTADHPTIEMHVFCYPVGPYQYAVPGDVIAEWDDGERNYAAVGQPRRLLADLRASAVVAEVLLREAQRVEKCVARWIADERPRPARLQVR